jgi:TRAP transporter TAXI family solute receptor
MRMMLAAALLLCSAPHAFAITDMTVLTGSETGTYVRIGRDLAKAVKPRGLDAKVETTGGSVYNVSRLSESPELTVGIVQSDVLGFLKRSGTPETKALASKMRLVFPLYSEEVHLLANKSLPDIAALNGKRVAVGAEGSGHWLTAMNVMSIMGVKPAEILRLSPPEAVSAVLRGKADAMFFVGGKPVKLFQNADALRSERSPAYGKLLKQVHFIALDDPKLLREYKASAISSADYLFAETNVPTIAVSSVLMTHGSDDKNLSPSERLERCEEISQLGAAIKSAFKELQASGHSKWKEVNLSAPMPLWQRDACVDKAGKPVAITAEKTLPNVGSLEGALLQSLGKKK